MSSFGSGITEMLPRPSRRSDAISTILDGGSSGSGHRIGYLLTPVTRMQKMPIILPSKRQQRGHAIFSAMCAATLVWFRLDLRLANNPELAAAAARSGRVLPVFIWTPEEDGDWPPGAASRRRLHQSLRSLDAALRRLGLYLILRQGPSVEALQSLVRESGADAVFWNRRYEPVLHARARERALEASAAIKQL